MKPMLVTSGEPAGIGPDICLALAQHPSPVVVAGDISMLLERAQRLSLPLNFKLYEPDDHFVSEPNWVHVLHIPCMHKVTPGVLDSANAFYVLDMLSKAIDFCLVGQFSALITAPVHKAIINQAGIPFTGHTEFLAERCRVETVVMMLACAAMKVALVTTHLPLRAVPDALSQDLIIQVANQLTQALQQDFGIASPRILVAGLNPHAGEGGYLGREEIDIINPALEYLKNQGIRVQGPYPADTMFTEHHLNEADAFLAMYHDQGLPVLKYAGFGDAVNVTLGLPIIRTSVDHGTALDLAGTGKASTSSLIAAVSLASFMVQQRAEFHDKN